jgi:hypothetical protein
MNASRAARIANIGPGERRKRLRFGVVAFGVSAAIGALLVASGVRPIWRLPLFVPLFLAGLGYFQARDKT